MKFRKRPVVIEAIRNTGTEESINEVLRWISERTDDFRTLMVEDDGYVSPGIGVVPALGTIDIPTLEGTMTAQPGDWIICGVQGEFYPCKPDIFEATYEEVTDGI
jgi:SOS-response transcriptional repressor LexA